MNGKLFGTTLAGGTAERGTVFRIDPPTGAEKVLYSFKGSPQNGAQPNGGLANLGGKLYGTTQTGGTTAACSNPANACGTVYAVTTTGAETLVHSFAGADGAFPESGLIGVYGTLYGTTVYGGVANVGTVFSVVP